MDFNAFRRDLSAHVKQAKERSFELKRRRSELQGRL
jgi:hypothetical protein